MIGFLIVALFAAGAIAATVSLADSSLRGVRAYRALSAQVSHGAKYATVITRVETVERYSERYAPRPRLVSQIGRSRQLVPSMAQRAAA